MSEACVCIEDSNLAPISQTLPEKIEAIEGHLLAFEQTEIPLAHRFAPGVYMREVFMPAGTFVIGHCHTTEHFNIVLAGRASVMMNGQVHQITAPCVIKSDVGVRKALYIHEDMTWATIHPTDETDLTKLEELLIVKSDTYLSHLDDLKQLQQALDFPNSPGENE